MLDLLSEAGFQIRQDELIGSELAYDRVKDTEYIHGYCFECIEN